MPDGDTPARKPGRPRKGAASEGGPPALSRAAVVACGYELCRATRLEDVSLDTVARRLGVSTTTVRHHIKNREALTLDLIDLYFRDLDARMPTLTGDWRIDLDNFLWTYMGLNIRRIGFASYFFEHRFSAVLDPFQSNGARTVHTRVLDILKGAGLNTVDAALGWHLIIHLILSIAYAEARGQTPADQAAMFESLAAGDATDPNRAVLAALRYVNLPTIFGVISNMIQNAIALKFDFPDVARAAPDAARGRL